MRCLKSKITSDLNEPGWSTFRNRSDHYRTGQTGCYGPETQLHGITMLSHAGITMFSHVGIGCDGGGRHISLLMSTPSGHWSPHLELLWSFWGQYLKPWWLQYIIESIFFLQVYLWLSNTVCMLLVLLTKESTFAVIVWAYHDGSNFTVPGPPYQQH